MNGKRKMPNCTSDLGKNEVKACWNIEMEFQLHCCAVEHGQIWADFKSKQVKNIILRYEQRVKKFLTNENLMYLFQNVGLIDFCHLPKNQNHEQINDETLNELSRTVEVWAWVMMNELLPSTTVRSSITSILSMYENNKNTVSVGCFWKQNQNTVHKTNYTLQYPRWNMIRLTQFPVSKEGTV